MRVSKNVPASTRKGLNQCDYRKMEESGRVPGNSRIRVSIEKLYRRVPEKVRISVSTEKWKNPGEYREIVESVRVSKKCHDEYEKMVESV